MSIFDFTQYTDAVVSAFISQVREVLYDYGLFEKGEADDLITIDDSDIVDHLDGCTVVVLPCGFD